MPTSPLFARLERDDMLAVGQHNASERHFVERADGFAEHRVGGVADLAVGHDVIGTHKIEVVDLQARTNWSISMVRVDSSAPSSPSRVISI